MPSSAEVGAWESCQECGLGSMGPQTGKMSPALALGLGAIFGGLREGFHSFTPSSRLKPQGKEDKNKKKNSGLPAKRGLPLELRPAQLKTFICIKTAQNTPYNVF